MEELPVITIAFEIYKKLLELNTKLDKKYRYSLGEQAAKCWSDTLLKVQARLSEARRMIGGWLKSVH